jgi:hypothetical protein
MCRLLDIGNTMAWELIGQGRVKTFTLGRRRLVVFSSIEELAATDKPVGAQNGGQLRRSTSNQQIT